MRVFKNDPWQGIDGTFLVSNCGTRLANDRDMDQFFRQAEPELDRLTLEMCAYHRAQGDDLEPWMLEAEEAAFQRMYRRNDPRLDAILGLKE